MRLGHALSGAAVGVWTLPVAQLPPAQAAAWVATAVGYAIAPDLDHPASAASRMWGPLSSIPAGVIARVFGHRGATHTWVAVAAVGLAAWWLTTSAGPVGLAAVAAVTAGLALAAVGVSPLPNLLGSAAAGSMVSALDVSWLPWAAALGVAAHIAGDYLTRGAMPGRGRTRWGIRTGGAAEAAVCIILAAVVVAYPFRGVIAAQLQGALPMTGAVRL